MIDFDALVIGPCLSVFGRPIYVTPRASQPKAPSYWASGDFRIANIDVMTEEPGGIASEQTLTMGVRLSSFSVPPQPKDQVFIPAHLSQPEAGPFWIDDTDDDPQGHSVWTLKECDPTPLNRPPVA